MWAVWPLNGKRHVDDVLDANLVTHLSLADASFQESAGYVAHAGDGSYSGTYTVKQWLLHAHRVDGTRRDLGPHLYSKGDAQRVLAAVGSLLDRQR